MTQLLRRHIHMCLLILGVWSAYVLSGITCPILLLTGHSCPTCGTTRALLALLHGNVAMYMVYQPMAFPLVIAVVLLLHLQHMKSPWNAVSLTVAGATLALNTVQYLARL